MPASKTRYGDWLCTQGWLVGGGGEDGAAIARRLADVRQEVLTRRRLPSIALLAFNTAMQRAFQRRRYKLEIASHIT